MKNPTAMRRKIIAANWKMNMTQNESDSYLDTFLLAPSRVIGERWHGVYPKMTDGSSELVFSPAHGVTVVNGLGGAGMTMSFGLAEEILESLQ